MQEAGGFVGQGGEDAAEVLPGGVGGVGIGDAKAVAGEALGEPSFGTGEDGQHH